MQLAEKYPKMFQFTLKRKLTLAILPSKVQQSSASLPNGANNYGRNLRQRTISWIVNRMCEFNKKMEMSIRCLCG